MASHDVTGGRQPDRPRHGLLYLVGRLVDEIADWIVRLSGPRLGSVIKLTEEPPSQACPGPMSYYTVTGGADLAECDACGYIAIAGTVYDIQHLDTPHREGLAT
jgi:hypothetical protein